MHFFISPHPNYSFPLYFSIAFCTVLQKRISLNTLLLISILLFLLQVVWRKASDPNPLTVGREKFADDPYIGVSHQATNWNLIIRNVQPRHAGVYECQVSSVHQLIRHIMLRVVGKRLRSAFHCFIFLAFWVICLKGIKVSFTYQPLIGNITAPVNFAPNQKHFCYIVTFALYSIARFQYK